MCTATDRELDLFPLFTSPACFYQEIASGALSNQPSTSIEPRMRPTQLSLFLLALFISTFTFVAAAPLPGASGTPIAPSNKAATQPNQNTPSIPPPGTNEVAPAAPPPTGVQQPSQSNPKSSNDKAPHDAPAPGSHHGPHDNKDFNCCKGGETGMGAPKIDGGLDGILHA
jgi:hypothetical protein